MHPGYGFLSENPAFAEACAAAARLVGPPAAIMHRLGNKVTARELAIAASVPMMPATPPLPGDAGEAARLAAGIGYPVMLKASWGGAVAACGSWRTKRSSRSSSRGASRAMAASATTRCISRSSCTRAARRVQILGDNHGNLVHLYERDCTVQRRNQKVVERAPAVFLDEDGREALCRHALSIGRAVGYVNAGTVEFLQDADTGQCYFIEVNPRIQVEHTVTEMVTGIDLVKAQIRIAEGAAIGAPGSGVPAQADIRVAGHAMQCRVTTEDPENNFIPDYGAITAYRSPAGFGIRLDAGTAYTGAFITRSYDSLLVKVTAWAPSAEETIARMHRALWEFRVRGVVTNLRFLDQVIMHALRARGIHDGSSTRRRSCSVTRASAIAPRGCCASSAR